MVSTNTQFGTFNKGTTIYTQNGGECTFQLSATPNGTPVATTPGDFETIPFIILDSLTRIPGPVTAVDEQGNFSFLLTPANLVMPLAIGQKIQVGLGLTQPPLITPGSIIGRSGPTTYYVIAASVWQKTTFATVDQAKSYFLTTDTLELHDTYCANLQWALTNDNQGLIVTMDFGINESPDSTQQDAAQYNDQKNALLSSGNWGANAYIAALSTNHLF